MTPGPIEELRPPRWMEAMVRWFLAPRDRETITGDLLEEYREEAVPARGHARATVWYLVQGASLMTHSKIARESAWVIVGGLMLSTLLFALNRTHFGPPVPLSAAVFVAVVLGITAATAMRSSTDLRFLGRISLRWAGVLSAVLVARMLVDVFKPLTEGFAILNQNATGRGFLLGVAMAVIFVAAGFHGTWQTGRVRMGILVATATSASGSLIVALYSPTPSSTESQVIKLLKKPMAKAKRRVQVHSLQVDYQGAAHHGTYVVERGILTVRSGLGSRSASAHRLRPFSGSRLSARA